MTNSEAIKQLIYVRRNLDEYLDEDRINAVNIAISALEENDKLKAEIEQLKAELEQSVKFPLTNADKIRSMSDEELAELLNNSIPIFNCDVCDIRPEQGSCNASSDECNSATLRWLKSEVENGN